MSDESIRPMTDEERQRAKERSDVNKERSDEERTMLNKEPVPEAHSSDAANTDVKVQAWCCEMQWPGRKSFIFGTVYHETCDQYAQVEESLVAKFQSKMGDILPLDCPQPKILRLMPGAIFFVPEEDFK